MDPVSSALFVFGLILLGVSWLLMLQVSFSDDYVWGLSTLFVPPLAYLYGCFAWSKAKESLYFAAGGCGLLFFSFI
ncbi:hypothetical protein L1F30_03095 [Simiduia sp. 21SJ11W-1]|uniref:hypothetical protein n=1 Tax=Simiduia sp. 21SJ11W-1 TaxID=2909669 RepID=UPI0020A18D2C|nr:hypothetical protein [Simiduia sp. 21SJ11W-1]UTA48540.1 hypothetical protein L1F30_03095 [Simiduia sp. 21SJ11W-1]